MTTAYADLSEDEKESDRREADRYLVHIEQLEQLVQRQHALLRNTCGWLLEHISDDSDELLRDAIDASLSDHDRIMHGGEDAST
jgi:hypothetical protein